MIKKKLLLNMNSNKGFTLIEIISALFLLGLFFSILFSLFFSINRFNKKINSKIMNLKENYILSNILYKELSNKLEYENFSKIQCSDDSFSFFSVKKINQNTVFPVQMIYEIIFDKDINKYKLLCKSKIIDISRDFNNQIILENLDNLKFYFYSKNKKINIKDKKELKRNDVDFFIINYSIEGEDYEIVNSIR